MASNAPTFTPGTLVRARGREWIVLPGSTDADTIRLRPVAGSEEDHAFIYLPLEREPVVPATFPYPHPDQRAGQDAALLLRDSLLLSLRRGAGPFRSFGQLSVEPRAYQLVPLLMALKLDPVRLLIGDDVGIGKTIEAGLILREFLDRGDAQRLTVLCPPHLVDQWVTELDSRFHIRAAAVTAASADRLQAGLPPGESIFSTHPYTVVSLDYIKAEKRRDYFLKFCPELVVVDEAHTCAATGQGRHQRYELLKSLSASKDRHLVLLTATPHSGDEAAFYRLLGLLDPDFEALADPNAAGRDRLRERLALHFVQRRRSDIDEWKEEKSLFPRRKIAEQTYRLSGIWEDFFHEVLDWCASVVGKAGADGRRRQQSFFGTLALMRCVASSPAAAALALRARSGEAAAQEDDESLEERVFDGASDDLSPDDVEPILGREDAELKKLLEKARHLTTSDGDPKLKVVSAHLKELLKDGFSPVVFCRFIATAHYLHERLKDAFPGVTVGVVTGQIGAEERREKVEDLGDAERRLLIATDCLSEGINLQEHFDAVVHYDLSWNPTRHEQREGRVDRFGQPKPVVRATLLYGENNPVDGAVLEVILKKAEKIRQDTGVPVPLPDDSHKLSQALLRAVMLRDHGKSKQGLLDFGGMAEAKEIDTVWTDAADKAKKNRTIFAQRRLKPDDVLPEWKRTLAALGTKEDVRRFTQRAMARLGAALEEMNHGWKAPLDALPEDVRERLESEGLSGTPVLDFDYPPRKRARAVLRSHPLVSVLAETILGRTLSAPLPTEGTVSPSDPAVLGRTGCWTTNAVDARTTILLLRLRHQLTSQTSRKTSTLLVEEANAVAWGGKAGVTVAEGDGALALLAGDVLRDPPAAVRDREIRKSLGLLDERAEDLEVIARSQADALLADHRRVREAALARGSYSVKALLPADVIGLFVLLPLVD